MESSEAQPVGNSPSPENSGDELEPVWAVGDMVQANYKRKGTWFTARVTEVHSSAAQPSSYNVTYVEDDEEERNILRAHIRHPPTKAKKAARRRRGPSMVVEEEDCSDISRVILRVRANSIEQLEEEAERVGWMVPFRAEVDPGE